MQRERHVLRVFVYRQRERIVTVVDLGQYPHAGPVQLACMGLGMKPIIEQAGKQRQASVDTAATLGRGQRRLFVAQQLT